MRITSAFHIASEHEAVCQSSLSIVLARTDAHTTGLDILGETTNPDRTL